MVIELSESKVIFEDDDIRVFWHEGKSSYLLITFGDLMSVSRPDDYFAKRPAEKAGITCLGLNAKRPNWYPASSVMSASRAALPFLSGYQTRLMYGGSMGGYGALKFSKLFEATHVIALCPQWSIDPNECGTENSGYADYFIPAMAAMGIRHDDIAGQCFIFVDFREDVDRFHQKKISSLWRDCVVVNVPLSGHHVTSALAGTGNLRALIDAVLIRDIVALNKFARERSLENAFRLKICLKRSAGRHPKLMYFIIENYFKNSAEVVEEISITLLVSSLLSKGYRSLATSLLTSFRRFVADPIDQFATAFILARLNNTSPLIRTRHGRNLCFDLVRRACLHADKDACEGELVLPMQFIQAREKICFFLQYTGHRIALGMRDDRVLDAMYDPSFGEYGSWFTLVGIEKGFFALQACGNYLSAEPSGRLICNRTKIGEWEKFSVV